MCRTIVAQTTHARCNLEPHNRDPLMQNILRTYIPAGGVSRISRNNFDISTRLTDYCDDICVQGSDTFAQSSDFPFQDSHI